MDPGTTPLGKMLLEEITPVVMVLRTPLVEEACLKNVPVRTSSDQPYRLQKFKLRLFYESDIRQPNLEVAKERLKQVITQAGEKDNSELCSDPPPIGSESEILPSWFEFFNKELVRTVSFSDHEAFDHPVACLLVVSSKDEQPINRFVDLFNTNKLPSLLNDGAMDPKILKHYLLKSVASPNQHLGCLLNIDDLNEIKDLMQELSSKHIIPYMEQKVRALNQQVSATRKGFRNQIKNLWWRKGKEDTPDSPSGLMYTFSSIESQIRVLGDYAFMLRDYELALSNYRLISTDYKLDKAWKRYAGVQEMMGLAYFMLDQSRKEAEYCMENAFNTYLQNATRCGLWWIEMLKTRDQYKEAATVYFRICSEESLHSAVMLEQASYCYLLSQPRMLHKYGFHLVLSGDRYKKCDQIKHAIRTYRSAISVYKGTTWSYIKDHVYFHIGQWYAFLGMYDVAFTHLLEVLTCSHQSKTTQELFLREFLQIVQRTGKTFEALKLQLPVINISSLKVVFEDHRTYASPAVKDCLIRICVVLDAFVSFHSFQASVRESLWRSLEEDMIPSLSTARTNCVSQFINLVFDLSEDMLELLRVLSEAIKVDIEFENPLKIPISISSVSLICELSELDEMTSDTSHSATELWNDEHKLLGDMSSDASLFTLSEVDFTLGGDETKLVQLTVTPKVEGSLRIVGIRWKLSGSVVGYYSLESNLGKRKTAKGRRKPKHSPGNDLKFVVIKSLPKLEGFIHSLPEKAYAGDLRHLVLELRNQSEFSVKNLKMKISHPRFLNIGDHEDLNLDIPDCLEKKTNVEQTDVPADSKKVSHGVFLFPEDISIEGERPLLWPLWLRAAVPGTISLYIVIYYEMGDASSVMRYRTLRMHYNLQVLPSLDVSFTISPCPSKLQEFLVRMDVVNKTSSESFQVNQLSSVGWQWEISLLQAVDAIFPSQSLIAGQALTCFFMLKEDTNTVDFILISRPLKSDINPGTSDAPRLFSHHAYAVASVGINTHDSPGGNVQLSDGNTVASGNQAGWHSLSPVDDIKINSDVLGSNVGKSQSPESVSPFIWSGTSSTRVQLEPMSSTEIPLQICVFSLVHMICRTMF
ncbi:hypothetical protein GH714_037427 [Hevea brasiliensis]|uniref:Uncharacterized protein n=1 Tax=Hevea brasiliensis TaxID=3981 RepID=A0A6A6KLG3_HEVBR|nr:hypothetical protein GH714_037427 [Hevea brasiliensis]